MDNPGFATLGSTRTAEPLDPFRSTYRELDETEKALLTELKAKAGELYQIYGRCNPTRQMSLAKTALEESVMWAVKSLTA